MPPGISRRLRWALQGPASNLYLCGVIALAAAVLLIVEAALFPAKATFILLAAPTAIAALIFIPVAARAEICASTTRSAASPAASVSQSVRRHAQRVRRAALLRGHRRRGRRLRLAGADDERHHARRHGRGVGPFRQAPAGLRLSGCRGLRPVPPGDGDPVLRADLRRKRGGGTASAVAVAHGRRRRRGRRCLWLAGRRGLARHRPRG